MKIKGPDILGEVTRDRELLDAITEVTFAVASLDSGGDEVSFTVGEDGQPVLNSPRDFSLSMQGLRESFPAILVDRKLAFSCLKELPSDPTIAHTIALCNDALLKVRKAIIRVIDEDGRYRVVDGGTCSIGIFQKSEGEDLGPRRQGVPFGRMARDIERLSTESSPLNVLDVMLSTAMFVEGDETRMWGRHSFGTCATCYLGNVLATEVFEGEIDVETSFDTRSAEDERLLHEKVDTALSAGRGTSQKIPGFRVFVDGNGMITREAVPEADGYSFCVSIDVERGN